MKKLLRLSEMAEVYRCSARTFSKYVREYVIPYRKLGKAKLFDPVEVDLLLRTQDEIIQRPSHKVTPMRAIEKRSKYADALGL